MLPEKVPAGTTFRPDAVTKAGHSVAVKYDGTLWAWGINNSGQLGTGNTDNCDEPVNVTPSGVKFKAVAAGGMHSLALDSEGNVWFTGTVKGRVTNSFTKIAGLKDIIEISAGNEFNLALDKRGNVYSWGDNSRGQLGISDNLVYLEEPALVPINSVTAISAGNEHC